MAAEVQPALFPEVVAKEAALRGLAEAMVVPWAFREALAVLGRSALGHTGGLERVVAEVKPWVHQMPSEELVVRLTSRLFDETYSNTDEVEDFTRRYHEELRCTSL